MKKGLRKILVVISAIFILIIMTGCGSFSYEISGGSHKMTIKANAEDGKYGEGFVMNISKNEIIVIDSQLDEGTLQIEFSEVINTATGDEADDYEIISLIKKVDVGAGAHIEFPLDYKGEFMPTFTAVGKTSGTLTISVVKQ